LAITKGLLDHGIIGCVNEDGISVKEDRSEDRVEYCMTRVVMRYYWNELLTAK